MIRISGDNAMISSGSVTETQQNPEPTEYFENTEGTEEHRCINSWFGNQQDKWIEES